MPYDQIGVEKVHVDGEDKYIVVLQGSQLRNPFRTTFDPESKEEAGGQTPKTGGAGIGNHAPVRARGECGGMTDGGRSGCRISGMSNIQ
jgi:hypothetical protein